MENLLKVIETVEAGYSEDAFENLDMYAREHLEPDGYELISGFIDKIKSDIRNNRKIDLKVSNIISRLPKKHKTKIHALVNDLPVDILMKRYDTVRLLKSERVSEQECVEMLRKYWIDESYRTDPDMPKAIARLVIEKISQWNLINLVYKELQKSVVRINNTDDEEEAAEELKKSGRIVLFLGWVPYGWAEEMLLELPEKFVFDNNVTKLRFWVSLMRALYFKPRIQRRTVKKLCESIYRHFDNELPRDLMRYHQGILVSGGENSAVFIEEMVIENPSRYCNSFYLNILADIDKVSCEHFIKENHELIMNTLSIKEYLRLLAATGEWDDSVVKKLQNIWNIADTALKESLLNRIIKFRWKRAGEFLEKIIDREKDLGIRLEIYKVIIELSDYPKVVEFVKNIDKIPLIFKYYLLEMCYHRIINELGGLLKYQDVSFLAIMENARKEIYSIYLDIFRLHRITEDSDLKNDLNIDIENIKRLKELLQFISKFNPEIEHNIFGNGSDVIEEDKMLNEKDIGDLYDNILENGAHACSHELLLKCGESLKAVREYFLFKGWFVRPAPYLLTENIFDLIEKINRGEELTFSPDYYKDHSSQTSIINKARMVYLCSNHGIYLTDHLLEMLENQTEKNIEEFIEKNFTHRRSLVTRGKIPFKPEKMFDRHLEFTTFAHIYRYGKESTEHLAVNYLWIKYLSVIKDILEEKKGEKWPVLDVNPEIQTVTGPKLLRMYNEQIDDSGTALRFIEKVFDKFHSRGIHVRIVPNINYGLFCISPILGKIHKKGIHVSLAGISSRFCDDINISEYAMRIESLYPVKPYLFSTASNYGTLNHDRVIIVIDGTMEPVDRSEPDKVRLPKSHRGYINHLAAVNYIRSRYGYGMNDPEYDVATSLRLSVRYVRNLIRTPSFKKLVDNLLRNFNKSELYKFQEKTGKGRTYYTFNQWNPDGGTVNVGSRGDVVHEVRCAKAENIEAPALIFVGINSVMKDGKIPAFFDNNVENEKPRIIIGPSGVWMDAGWPHREEGMVVEFPEAGNM